MFCSSIDNILSLPYFECIQNLFNYASPILIGAESIKIRSDVNIINEYWYHVLQTTRILLAHCTVMSGDQEHFINMIAANIRNLYRLYGIDIADKEEMWNMITTEEVYYILPNEAGKYWISNDFAKMIGEICSTSFAQMETSFKGEENKTAQQTFGHCVYKLIATSDTGWQTTLRTNYKVLIN